jgi:hypothetical protein
MENVLDILPLAMTQSTEFLALPDEDRVALAKRILAARVMANDLRKEARYDASGDIYRFAEEIELDLAILQEFDGAARGGFSRWLLHYSWTFGTSPNEMMKAIPVAVVNAIDQNEPHSQARLEVYRSWFRFAGENLFAATSAFSSSSTFASALASHIAIDVLLSRILTVCYKLRLNCHMER